MRWRWAGRAGAGLLLAFAGVATGIEVWGARAQPAAHADAIVVMGCPPDDDGTLSDCLARRVAGGVVLWKQGRAPSLVLTGGELRGLEAEARVAARHALELGVPGSAIVLEPTSTNTWENASFTVKIARPASVIVVTDDAHLLRATRCFQALGVPATGQGVDEGLKGRITGAVREVVALADYGLRGRLAPPKRAPSAPPT